MKRTIAPPDLEILVRLSRELGRTRLTYTLNSPGGAAPFTHREIAGPIFQGSPEDLHRRMVQQIEELGRGLDMDGALVLRSEVRHKLEGLGRSLWQQLFNDEMQQAYRRFRESVQTLLIVSDEPWIPWEMVKPYDDRGDLLDDGFFAERFELTRWLSGDRSAAAEIVVPAVACVLQGQGLSQADAERKLVVDRFGAGLRDASPPSPSVEDLIDLLARGGIGLFHFIGHGSFDARLPNEAGFLLEDGSVFRASDLHGPAQTQIGKDRPMVFLNACSSGRQAWSWTGLGGWADRWVRCGCGAFIGPQWKVKDSAAAAFARGLYESLSRGETLGKAAQTARQEARKTLPDHPSWLAYAVYGHPNARILLGEATEAESPQPDQEVDRRPEPAQPPAPASSSNLRIKRRFTDHDKDRFIDETFDYIADFFRSSLAQLQQQHSALETKFRRVDQNQFLAAVYVDGKKESACRVWLDRGHLGDIAYAASDSGNNNTYNEALSAADDGDSLFFQPLGLRFFGSSDRKQLSPQEAAEYLWSMLIERLQR
ncbi:MAG: CHAT domain-containing protein [Acidobacteriota bacterium]